MDGSDPEPEHDRHAAPRVGTGRSSAAPRRSRVSPVAESGHRSPRVPRRDPPRRARSESRGARAERHPELRDRRRSGRSGRLLAAEAVFRAAGRARRSERRPRVGRVGPRVRDPVAELADRSPAADELDASRNGTVVVLRDRRQLLTNPPEPGGAGIRHARACPPRHPRLRRRAASSRSRRPFRTKPRRLPAEPVSRSPFGRAEWQRSCRPRRWTSSGTGRGTSRSSAKRGSCRRAGRRQRRSGAG